MIKEVLMPKLGQTMETATVEKWHKKEGEKVERGEVLLEITTDKATLEVESYVAGTLRKIIAVEGTTLPVNAVIALIGEPNDPLPANLDELAAAVRTAAVETRSEKTEDASSPTQTATGAVVPTGVVMASPRAKTRAREHKVSLKLISGSGPGGRIVEKDVMDYVARRDKLPITPTALKIAYQRGVDVTTTSPRSGRITKEDVLAAQTGATPSRRAGQAPSAMRRLVAERMTRSKREIPHFYVSVEADMTEAAALRAQLNKGRGDKGVSFNVIIIKACALALREVPAMKAVWSDGGIVQRPEFDIGLAVALDEGLIVPVVRRADALSLEEIAAELRRLVEKARSKRLTSDDYEGGVFTISNLGMFGIESFMPIINPGQSAILGVGAIAAKPVVVGDSSRRSAEPEPDAIRVRQMMNLTLSADHRVIDGAVAAKFLARVRELLENPAELTAGA